MSSTRMPATLASSYSRRKCRSSARLRLWRRVKFSRRSSQRSLASRSVGSSMAEKTAAPHSMYSTISTASRRNRALSALRRPALEQQQAPRHAILRPRHRAAAPPRYVGALLRPPGITAPRSPAAASGARGSRPAPSPREQGAAPARPGGGRASGCRASCGRGNRSSRPVSQSPSAPRPAARGSRPRQFHIPFLPPPRARRSGAQRQAPPGASCLPGGRGGTGGSSPPALPLRRGAPPPGPPGRPHHGSGEPRAGPDRAGRLPHGCCSSPQRGGELPPSRPQVPVPGYGAEERSKQRGLLDGTWNPSVDMSPPLKPFAKRGHLLLYRSGYPLPSLKVLHLCSPGQGSRREIV